MCVDAWSVSLRGNGRQEPLKLVTRNVQDREGEYTAYNDYD